jgi:colanic acid/amylovoran biosynthesis protein
MNILLLNAHSPKNAGDLAILRETLACLHSAFPDAQITVAINDLDLPRLPSGATYVASFTRWLVQIKPAGEWRWRKFLALPYGLWLFLGSSLYYLTKLRLLPHNAERRKLMSAYYAADLVVVSGGGHLYGRHALNITFFWLWVGLALAVLMNKPLVFLPQSFGPLAGTVQCHLLRWLLEQKQSTFIAAREYCSVQLLANIGLCRRVVTLPDLAFIASEAIPEVLETAIPEYASICAGDRPIVGLTLMNWQEQNPRFANQQAYENAMLMLIEYLHNHYNAQIILFAQCTGPTLDQDDRYIARRVLAAAAHLERICFIDAILPPEILKAAYRKLDMLVATRMHSAIFAMSVGVPVLIINYLHKSAGIMEMMGLSRYAVEIDQMQGNTLCALFDHLWMERSAISQHLLKRMVAVESTLTHLPELLRSAL